MARTHLDLKTVRNPVKLVRAEAIKAKLDEHDTALDALDNAIGQAEDLQAPDLADDDRFLALVAMQATAYTLDNEDLPADNPPRNVVLTHATVDTTDTLGDAVVTGTNVDDEVITETITLVADSAVAGVKAFKTVTSIITAAWVQGGATPDNIKAGFGNKLGLSRTLTAASQVFLTTLGTAIVTPTVTVDSDEVEKNTVDLSGGTYDGTKLAKALLVI